MATIDLGTVSTLPVAPKSVGYEVLTSTNPTNVYAFELSDFGSLNIGLDSVSGNTNLKLYRDTNENGQLDALDQLLTTAQDNNMFGGGDEGINYTATAGKYLAQVTTGSSLFGGSGDYRMFTLDLSATSVGTASNVVPSEFQVGILGHYQVKTFTGNINSANTADVYAFSTSPDVGVEIKLTGLSSNANIRLIKDLNKNGVVDFGEQHLSSNKLGTASESIKTTLGGDYLLQVYQGSAGTTNYNLQIEAKPTIG